MNLQSWASLLAALLVAAAVVAEARRRAERSARGRRFFRHPPAAPGLGVLAFFTAIALAAPLIAPYAPERQLDIVQLQHRPPSLVHLLGTDVYSRDVWSRLIYGSRVSLTVGALAMLVAVSLGALVGAVAGYVRRWADATLMRLVDVGLAMPRIFLILMVVALWERIPLALLILLIGLTGWFPTSRLVRAEVLSLRERAFVDAARALGAPPARVIAHHVLPNAAAPIIVSAALGIGNVLLLEASLSFLGVGVPPPWASWGNMIADGAAHVATAPWTTVFPGLTIALVVMALNAVADGLRDALDPRGEGR